MLIDPAALADSLGLNPQAAVFALIMTCACGLFLSALMGNDERPRRRR